MTKQNNERRRDMTDHEQMLDAQAGCIPCKLCGGSAEIYDAGPGSGYYIACANSRSFHASRGCLISDRRLGGYAYNAMEWWNRLHKAEQTPIALAAPDMLEALQMIGAYVDSVDRTPIIAAHNMADAFRLYAAPLIADLCGPMGRGR